MPKTDAKLIPLTIDCYFLLSKSAKSWLVRRRRISVFVGIDLRQQVGPLPQRTVVVGGQNVRARRQWLAILVEQRTITIVGDFQGAEKLEGGALAGARPSPLTDGV